MKFLCLHGNGTNSHVMQLQTAPLRHELEDGHDYEFVEGAIEIPMAEGVEAMSLPEHRFYAYYNPDDLSTAKRAMDQLDDYIATEGPFDVVMGFSAGAVLAAMYLIQKQRQAGSVPFKCAVFLASANNTAEMGYLGADVSRDLIRIPTAHIWGSADQTAPMGGADLSKMCDPTQRFTLVHDAGHELPKQTYLTQAVQGIRKTVYLAN
ncbi:serine hydrolase FSH [Hypomontagnella monticulosa]|nr:serine hydrolase FSH [Hypomontagnella monticulosa]